MPDVLYASRDWRSACNGAEPGISDRRLQAAQRFDMHWEKSSSEPWKTRKELQEVLLVCAEEALKLASASAQAALSGRGRLQIVRRIAEATSAAKQAPAMRAKAIKALSGVVKADTGLLALPEIQHSINGALKVCSQEAL